jgi:Ribonuclease HI
VRSKLPARNQIIRQLADALDDDILQRIFPGQHPDDIRGLLLDHPPASSKHVTPATFSAQTRQTASTPIPDRCRLFTDGASRGNPGYAGAGVVLLDEQGEELATRSVYLGTCTNNVAEYKALIVGLEEALCRRCAHVAIFLDSELIVRQILGQYKIKSEMLLPFFHQAQERLDQFTTWSIAHVPRAQNARADQLANQGIDQKMAGDNP